MSTTTAGELIAGFEKDEAPAQATAPPVPKRRLADAVFVAVMLGVQAAWLAALAYAAALLLF